MTCGQHALSRRRTHPNMDLSDEESTACAKSAKNRLFTLILLLIIFHEMKLFQLSTGITIGIVMTALTLVLAYILKGGKENEAAEHSY